MWLPFAFGLIVVIITVHIAIMMMIMMMMKREDCYGDDKSSTHFANIDIHYHHQSFVLADSFST